ncbi:hypothetical protein GQ53DRAFT_740995 [Thozetella sp. PMI_491]|nr:hypothetical protein GQ53DRAFT_740995 [Thozetella sp. PMI_491]
MGARRMLIGSIGLLSALCLYQTSWALLGLYGPYKLPVSRPIFVFVAHDNKLLKQWQAKAQR